jgi:hypothetical protein
MGKAKDLSAPLLKHGIKPEDHNLNSFDQFKK